MTRQQKCLMFVPALELAFVTERARRSRNRSLLAQAVVCSLWFVMLILYARTTWALPRTATGR